MPKKKMRRSHKALIGLGVTTLAIAGTWVAIHEVPGFGPALADGTRAVLGPRAVAWAEDVAYGVADRVNLWRYRDDKPKTLWDDVEEPASPEPMAVPAEVTPAAATPSRDEFFPPPGFEPPCPEVRSAADGRWRPVVDPNRPDEVVMAKTMVHPDPKRSFAAIAVIAIDLRKVQLRLVAGAAEPASETVPQEKRPGIIPAEVRPDLIAVFNGGFKAIHGHYGMMIDGDTYLPPRERACTVGLRKDGSVRIGTWSEMKASGPELVAYRQTPPCLVEHDDTNDVLDADEYTRNWGAAVGGATLIRRSAVGVDATGNILFYGLGDSVTAIALARGMKAVGAVGAAQLDVNYSYPRFLFYQKRARDGESRAYAALIRDIKFTSYEYVLEASPRDFFYLAWRPRVRAAL